MSPKRIYGNAYTVLVSADRKYSLIPAGTPVPGGWKPTGKQGTKEQCIKYIEEVWTDMTPIDKARLLKL